MLSLRTISHAICLAFFSASSLAQEGPSLPAVSILGCEEYCAKWTDPKPRGKHFLHSPNLRPGEIFDAYAVIRFTVGVDGHVRDPVLVNLLGPEKFGRIALDTALEWEYEPATADGKPADRPNWFTVLAWESVGSGARPDIFLAYKNAKSRIRQGKIEEAQALLLPILQRPQLYLFERSITSLVLATTYALQKDYLTARDYSEDATIGDGRFLDRDTLEGAFRQRIRLEAVNGHYGDALEWFEKLKKLKQPSPGDEIAVLAGQARAALDSPDPIRVYGRIPKTATQFAWRHRLQRRNFAIPVISGNLTKLQIWCDQKITASAVTDTAQWHIPKSWSNCTLMVFGDPGATFQLVETNE